MALTHCSDLEAEPPGQLMLALGTDMAVPKDLDRLVVELSTRDGAVFSTSSYRLPDQLRLPATLAVVDPDNEASTVRARVLGYRGSTLRITREAVTTIPTARAARLDLPLHWLCTDPANPRGCTDGQTCRAGRCETAEVSEEQLESFQPQGVFGGGAQDGIGGRCFDVLACLADGQQVAELEPTCTLTVPSSSPFNLGIRHSSEGLCAGPGDCYLPLDRATETQPGWEVLSVDVQAGRATVQLPLAVCSRLAREDVRGLTWSSACAPKLPSQPACGSWSTVSIPQEVYLAPSRQPVQAAPSAATGGSGLAGGSQLGAGLVVRDYLPGPAWGAFEPAGAGYTPGDLANEQAVCIWGQLPPDPTSEAYRAILGVNLNPQGDLVSPGRSGLAVSVTANQFASSGIRYYLSDGIVDWCVPVPNPNVDRFIPYSDFRTRCWEDPFEAGGRSVPYAGQPLLAFGVMVTSDVFAIPFDVCLNGFADARSLQDLR